ncbi:MAG: nitroreductase family deazaflavin-dependent oxidoreductase [Acidimicrobiia bacterium]
MAMARHVARFNRVVTNRVQMLWAPRVAPWAVIVHTGRRSGREYRTPVVAFTNGSRVTIALAYGADTDWVRNLLAADGGKIVRRGRESRLADPAVVTPDAADLPRRVAPLLRRVSHVLTARVA